MRQKVLYWIAKRACWLFAVLAFLLIWVGVDYIKQYNSYPDTLSDNGIHTFIPESSWEEHMESKRRRSGVSTVYKSSYYFEMKSENKKYKYKEPTSKDEALKPADKWTLKTQKRVFLTPDGKGYYVGEITETPEVYLDAKKSDALESLAWLWGSGVACALLAGLCHFKLKRKLEYNETT